MTDEFDEELDEFERGRAEAQAERAEDEASVVVPVVGKKSAAASDGVLGSEFTLEDLAKPGSRWEELASELIVARSERAALAEAAKLDSEIEDGLASGVIDFNDPSVRFGLGVQVADARAVSDAAFLAGKEAELSKIYGEDTVRQLMSEERAALLQVQAFQSAENLYLEHPAYVEWAAREASDLRALEFARDRSLPPDFGLAELEADVQATYRAFVSAGKPGEAVS